MDPSDYQKDPRPVEPSQLSTSLPGVNVFVTTHEPESGKSVIHSKRVGKWKPQNDNRIASFAIYTADDHTDLNDEKDIKESDEAFAGNMPLVRKGGSVCRYFDMAPGASTPMHRTITWDLGIVVEGSVELELDDGSKTLIRRGDTIIQRGTMHRWTNTSEDTWLRMLFVQNEVKPLTVAGTELEQEFKA